jgi:4-diphosphocytidyl-2-C-methyl-D-erythritol kinase
MMALYDTAKAKVNLTLEVLGRRADGYHELRSVVAFTAFGDSLTLAPGPDLALAVEGPFGAALDGRNLVIAAAEAARAEVPGIVLGRFHLTKALPVAAGLGGGSADAAAALRLLALANPGTLSEAMIATIAESLGSDVTACRYSRPALMTGRGEIVRDLPGFPTCGVLLANPRVPLATASVYGALAARPLPAVPGAGDDIPDFAASFERLIDYASARRNDLEASALKLVPTIGAVLDALGRCRGARLVQLSGSGPTCFALFARLDEAEVATRELAAAHRDWWITASTLAGEQA